METMAVTAAIPMTTPKIVKPARSLFFASARVAIRNVLEMFIYQGKCEVCWLLGDFSRVVPYSRRRGYQIAVAKIENFSRILFLKE
jgi:hypothetical protein